MKKLFFTLVLAIASIYAMAQENTVTNNEVEPDTTFSTVTRVGNTYMVDGTAMNKRAFMGFLQSRDAVTYQTFRSAYQLAGAGWGLLAAGLALEISSFPVLMAGSVKSSQYAAENPTEEGSKEAADGVYSSVLAGYVMLIGGDIITVAGVTCISLGYVRMHQTADCYNATQKYKRKKAAGVNVALQSSRDGLGIALQF